MDRIAPTVWVARLAPGLWLHTTTDTIDEDKRVYYPANGLLLEGSDGSVLVDGGWTREHAEVLLEWAEQTLRRPVSLAVATHFHGDRTGGIPACDAAGIPSLAHPLTRELAMSRGESVPSRAAEFVADVAQVSQGCELYFPGPGHTRDNIVAWFPRQRVLFGGCFLKSVTSKDFGNVADSVPAEWTASVQRVQARYPARAITVPGHGTIAGDAIAHTLRLVAKTYGS